MKQATLPPWYLEARDLYEKKKRPDGTHVSLRDLAKHFGKNVKSVRNAILRAGGTMRTELAQGGGRGPAPPDRGTLWTGVEKSRKDEALRLSADKRQASERRKWLRYEAISRAYFEPGATSANVAKQFGISKTAVFFARQKCGVTAKEQPKRDRRSADILAPSRGALLFKALGEGAGPFTLRDAERRFQACSAFGAALAFAEAEKLGAVVTWEPWPISGGVRLTLKARPT